MSTAKELDEVRRLIADAVEDHSDGLLEPERLVKIQQLLLTDAAARYYFLVVNRMNAEIGSIGMTPRIAGHPSRPSDSIVRSSRWFSMRIAKVLAVAASIVAITMLFNFGRRPSGEVARGRVTLESVSGDVRVAGSNHERAGEQRQGRVSAGDTIQTQGSLSSTILAFADGTRLSLVGNTSLTLLDEERKSLVLHRGTVFGSVAPQPAASPMLLVTPRDKLQVLGTRFALDASSGETDLSVSEGLVRLTRLRDGQSVEVPAGRRVLSSSAAQLVVEAIPEPPDEWSEDFENGLPDGWVQGQLVETDLPSGSRGAVRAVHDATPAGTFAVVTPEEWTHGLFAVHPDSLLHLTIKMDDPGWFNIFILTRTVAGDPPIFAGNYIYDQQLWFGEPGAWGTVTVPLTNFRPLPPSPPRFENALPFQVMCSSPDRDRGLVIDRMWVTRGKSDTGGTAK